MTARPGAWGRDVVLAVTQQRSLRVDESADDRREALIQTYMARRSDLASAFIDEIMAGVTEAGAALAAPKLVDVALKTEGEYRLPYGLVLMRPASKDALRVLFGRRHDPVVEIRTEIDGRVETRHVPIELNDTAELAFHVAGAAVDAIEAARRLVSPFLRLAAVRYVSHGSMAGAL